MLAVPSLFFSVFGISGPCFLPISCLGQRSRAPYRATCVGAAQGLAGADFDLHHDLASNVEKGRVTRSPGMTAVSPLATLETAQIRLVCCFKSAMIAGRPIVAITALGTNTRGSRPWLLDLAFLTCLSRLCSFLPCLSRATSVVIIGIAPALSAESYVLSSFPLLSTFALLLPVFSLHLVNFCNQKLVTPQSRPHNRLKQHLTSYKQSKTKSIARQAPMLPSRPIVPAIAHLLCRTPR